MLFTTPLDRSASPRHVVISHFAKAEHPPAGATTLIVALTLLGLLVNRASGIPYPLWSDRRPH
jgi:hypothetical protein